MPAESRQPSEAKPARIQPLSVLRVFFDFARQGAVGAARLPPGGRARNRHTACTDVTLPSLSTTQLCFLPAASSST